MAYYDDNTWGCGCLLSIFSIFGLLYGVMKLSDFVTQSEFLNYFHVILFILLLLLIIFIIIIQNKYKQRKVSIIELNQKIENYQKQIHQLNSNIINIKDDNKILKNKNATLLKQNKDLNEKIKKLEELIHSKTPFSSVSILVRDLVNAIFHNEEMYLQYKPRPARTAAEAVKNIKEKYKELLGIFTIMQYKYNFLLRVFPELSNYIEDEEALISLDQTDNIEQFKEEYDSVKSYLSTDEYQKLTENERNQLALDRYKERRRSSNWIAGVEYEMFCSHLLRERGYKVIDYGIQKKLDDLGRDIIASNDKFILVIQCKRYSENKEIHENTICQLFGTTLHFQITEAEIHNAYNSKKIIPVLITTAKLSNTAKEFASKLNVRVLYIPMGEYPMIKCNINKGTQIYHLPFDQQYWKTTIDKPGEFFASTVREASERGFRRAFKYNYNSTN